MLLETRTKIACNNEYDTLKKVIVCDPKYMTIREVINETQKHYKEDNISIDIAMKQHKKFVELLKEQNVEVINLPSLKKYHEQVFTRDIGFVIGEIIFVANMANEARIGEEDILKNYLEGDVISYYNLIGDQIEGGDVLIDGRNIYIGLSNRTNESAVHHMQKLLPRYTIIPISFKEKYLHLDCVFNIISPHEALYYPEAFDEGTLKELKNHYDLIPVCQSEQFSLGTNVFSVGNKKIFSLITNKKINTALSERGYSVIEVEFSEIIKSGGSFRCCTLPILRK
ncbi:N-dimethylarginine dimethylaminohydrolase [Natranaerovirga hydrolytica]|uniref:N-dimethylarginine dimethylaminohydrolase n=1 Tax=Natranaerovirga hydrolytica TaxID=680378 RepID=A0A4R1MSA5_9FIRM|nr:dimethylarginine dimethylaminohydrolase family protein [Natranaerovirga hydrolytica]TCK92803.1 N-dimethylarginine dimethylaminohydrolase [Natranaerovirga hydrolytica]